jgi:hypothetical protein
MQLIFPPFVTVICILCVCVGLNPNLSVTCGFRKLCVLLESTNTITLIVPKYPLTRMVCGLGVLVNAYSEIIGSSPPHSSMSSSFSLVSSSMYTPLMTNNFLHRCPGTNFSSQLKHNPRVLRSCILVGDKRHVGVVLPRVRFEDGNVGVVSFATMRLLSIIGGFFKLQFLFLMQLGQFDCLYQGARSGCLHFYPHGSFKAADKAPKLMRIR